MAREIGLILDKPIGRLGFLDHEEGIQNGRHASQCNRHRPGVMSSHHTI